MKMQRLFLLFLARCSRSMIIITEAWTLKSSLASKPISMNSPSSSGNRRKLLTTAAQTLLGLTLSVPHTANAAETVGKDPDCNYQSCLGVWDGLLADCPHDNINTLFGKGGGAGCTSSQDDTPGIFSEPWDYSESPINGSLEYENQMKLLRPTIERVLGKRGDYTEVILQQDRYLRMIIVDGKSGEKSIGEFYFTPNDTTVQFRIANLAGSNNKNNPANNLLYATSMRNIDRGELIRKELRYLKIPVLRNRKRSLFFVESDLDTFGPGSASLGPIEDLNKSEIDNGRLSDNVDPKIKIDLLQQFPLPSEK